MHFYRIFLSALRRGDKVRIIEEAKLMIVCSQDDFEIRKLGELEKI